MAPTLCFRAAAIKHCHSRWRTGAERHFLAILGLAAAWAALCCHAGTINAYVPEPPGPLALRPRTKRLRDQQTGLPRAPPAEADVALDYFQKTFPGVSTQEHILIHRWERLSELFGGGQAANELVLKEPQILRVQKYHTSRAFHYLTMYLGPQLARYVSFECPYLLTKRGASMQKTLPALLNVFATKKRLQEVIRQYPGLLHTPVSHFYHGMQEMIAVAGNAEKAMAVGKDAMDRIKRSPLQSYVPQPYPALVAIFGGLEAAHDAINREPLLLIQLGDQFLGKLAKLREIFGSPEAAQDVLKRAPFFLLRENQRKGHKFQVAFDSLVRVFGEDEAIRMASERPLLLSLGSKLQRALRFAERKLGGIDEVRENFESVLRRTGLDEAMEWENLPRPRHGLWTPSMDKIKPRHFSWSPHANPGGASAPPRGRWDELEIDEIDLPDDLEAIPSLQSVDE
mmetsp:Transcript_55100/g.102023  ORF Transcript_55100/g.102023 Transcript_55100/m.102023 type:complete len:455 (+) Transcript_55100:49-1413(+)